MYWRIVTFLVVINIANAYDREHVKLILYEYMTVNSIVEFCNGKVKIDFCSKENRKIMDQVLEMQREKARLRLEKIRQQRLVRVALIVQQFKLKMFIAQNPRYKFMNDFVPQRFF
jgi:hypothetical protein